jgi:hypothetical protein
MRSATDRFRPGECSEFHIADNGVFYCAVGVIRQTDVTVTTPEGTTADVTFRVIDPLFPANK